jgi:gamma-glutamylcyclotransferase (GGCT)/AIG2-like uncharacterized protein YtfP
MSRVYPLFVYGSLRSGFQSPAYEYISRHFNLVGPAKVRGKLFDMGDYPAGVPVREDLFITGELYAIKNELEFSWAIGQLDDYEGVMPESGESSLYRRELTMVSCDGKDCEAWVYWYNGETGDRPFLESGDIMDYIK